MVVGDDEVDTERAGAGGGLDGADAGIEADDEADALARGLVDDRFLHAVAFH